MIPSLLNEKIYFMTVEDDGSFGNRPNNKIIKLNKMLIIDAFTDFNFDNSIYLPYPQLLIYLAKYLSTSY